MKTLNEIYFGDYGNLDMEGYQGIKVVKERCIKDEMNSRIMNSK